MTSLKPRDYQLEAIDEVENAWEHDYLRPAVVLPTGAGKTVTFAHLISRYLRHNKARVVVLVHRDELARQAADKITSVIPDLEVGIVKAEQNETDARVVVASVQTLFSRNRREQLRGNLGLVVVDECHHYAAPAYREVLEELGLFDGSVLGVGFTATMNRSDTYGLGDIWESVVFERDILWGIINGFLVDVRAESVTVDDLNLAEIARNHGDYQEGKLGDALIASGAAKIVAKAYGEKAGTRQGIAFCPTVAAAEDLCRAFDAEAIYAALITGETPIDRRQEIYDLYRQGEVRVLVSVMALTEGFDMPQAEVAVMYRPARSASLRIQCIGRVLRPFPGKEDALVLDVVGAVSGGALTGLTNLSKTIVPPEPGESVAEAYERDLRESESVEQDVIAGKVTSHVVSLFKSSTAVWSCTPGGTWFVPTRDGYVFLWALENGKFRVGITGSRYSMKGGSFLVEKELQLEMAMAWGEQLSKEIDPLLADKDRSWRTKRAKPSEKQLALAKRNKISYPDGVRKHELAELIDMHFATRIFDKG